MKHTHILGIDEAGRGPLAGRVFVGGVLLSVAQHSQLKRAMRTAIRFFPSQLKDSKKLSHKQREEWFLWMKNNSIVFTYHALPVACVDRINISKACYRGVSRVIAKIEKKGITSFVVVADGSLKPEQSITYSFSSKPKADENDPAVALASIVAKVLRDREMVHYDMQYPKYGFAIHKGYGTLKHRMAIKRYGVTPIHRKTYLKGIISL